MAEDKGNLVSIDKETIKRASDSKPHRQLHGLTRSLANNMVVGVTDGYRDWATWFEAYFRFIELHPVIKGFCYINWDWSQYKAWKTWGEARLSQGEYVLEEYRKEMQKPKYLHAGPDLFRKIGFAPRSKD